MVVSQQPCEMLHYDKILALTSFAGFLAKNFSINGKPNLVWELATVVDKKLNTLMESLWENGDLSWSGFQIWVKHFSSVD
jgi:hypothetical protein